MRSDAYGLPVTTTSVSALEAYDRAVHEFLGWGHQALELFQTSAEHDPALGLAHAGTAVCLFLDERFVEARAAVERACATAETQTPRERSHANAVALVVNGRTGEAETAMREHLAAYPRDLMIFHRLYFVWFWQGRFPEMLDATTRSVTMGDGNSFLLGLHAFALEEGERFPDAMRAAEAAIAKNEGDAWAVHALAHVLYETGAFDVGLTRLPLAIRPCTHLGWFRNHLLWHLALMHLAHGNYEQANQLSRAAFERVPSAIAGDLHDSISLLWRFELCARPVGERWNPFVAIARERLNRQGLLFHVAHVGMALAGGRDWTTGDQQLAALRDRIPRDRTGLLADLVLPLVEGMRAFAAGEYARVIERIEPIRPRVIQLGGSRAQRDVFHDTLLEACFRAGEMDRAERFLAERVARRPEHFWVTRRGALRGA